MYVYFIRAGNNGPIKIGMADNVENRLEALQTGNHLKLQIVTKIKFKSRAEAFEKERQFHKMFYHKQIRGEWFDGNIRINSISEMSEADKSSLEEKFLSQENDRLLLTSCPF